MKIVVTGSSGTIGSALVDHLRKEKHDVYTLVRRDPKNVSEIFWDPEKKQIDSSSLENMDSIVHLSGESIMGIWTENKKKKIRDSRVESTKFLGQVCEGLRYRPSVFVCASAIGFYGDQGNEILTESSKRKSSFLSDVCVEWEKATAIFTQLGMRTVNVRTGFVVSPNAGGIKNMLPVFRLGLGGRVGSGHQYMSWIALEDLVRVFTFVLQDSRMVGSVNGVSPHPVTNLEWTKTLGKVLHRPTFCVVPAFAVEWILGQMGREVLLSSLRVLPEKLEKNGFTFEYPELKQVFALVCGL